MKYEHSILFVDDEPSILKSLTRLLRKTDYVVQTAPGGIEALELIQNHERPFSLIISDQKMPQMTGSEFLSKSRELLPYAMRFLLTGYSEIDLIVDAINKGQIHRFIHKPWNDHDLLLSIEQGIKQYELVLENKRLMIVAQKQNSQLKQISRDLEEKVRARTEELNEKTTQIEESFYNIIRSFSALIEYSTPDDNGHGRRVSALSAEIGLKAGMTREDLRDLEVSALLHDIGKIGLPQFPPGPFQDFISENQKNIYKKHSTAGHDLLRFIPQLENVGTYIKHHHEHYNGTGFPDGISAEEIPLQSRIIAVVDTYDRISNRTDLDDNPVIKEYLISSGKRYENYKPGEIAHQSALYYIKHNTGSFFDPNVIKLLLDTVKSPDKSSQNEKELTLDQIRQGMKLTRPLYSIKGRFLLPYNAELSSQIINKLKSIHRSEPVQEPIYVKS